VEWTVRILLKLIGLGVLGAAVGAFALEAAGFTGEGMSGLSGMAGTVGLGVGTSALAIGAGGGCLFALALCGIYWTFTK
jgi:hypothetical protein